MSPLHRPRLTRLTTLATGAATLAAGVGLAVVSVSPASATTNCSSSSCLTNVQVQPGGLSSGFTFATTVPTVDKVSLYRNGLSVASATSGTYRTSHQLSSTATLEAGTTYDWDLTVTDAAGNTQERTGTMRTLRRQVLVNFTNITVTKDSDSQSSGEFRTRFRVADVGQYALMVPQDIESGQTVLAAQPIITTGAGVTTRASTEMYDTDFVNPVTPWTNDFYGYSYHTPFTSGSSWTGDWATANVTLDTKNATPLSAFQAVAPSTGPVGFVVRGWYSVSFVA